MPALTAIREVDDAALRAARIEATLESKATDEELGICLEAYLELPETAAVPILPTIANAGVGLAPPLRARACFAVARFGFGEFVPPFVQPTIAAIDDTMPLSVLAPVVTNTIRAYQWLDMRAEIAAFLDKVIRLEGVLDIRLELIVAGGIASLGGAGAHTEPVASLRATGQRAADRGRG
jgi:hypothetical protein